VGTYGWGAPGQRNNRWPVGSMRGPCQVAQPVGSTAMQQSMAAASKGSRIGLAGRMRGKARPDGRIRGEQAWSRAVGKQVKMIARLGRASANGIAVRRVARGAQLLKRTAYEGRCWQIATGLGDFSQRLVAVVRVVAAVRCADGRRHTLRPEDSGKSASRLRIQNVSDLVGFSSS
jgi:hypothetical protein